MYFKIRKRREAYKIVCSEWNVIKKVHLQFFTNQGGSISVPIQTHFFTERKKKWAGQIYLGGKKLHLISDLCFVSFFFVSQLKTNKKAQLTSYNDLQFNIFTLKI